DKELQHSLNCNVVHKTSVRVTSFRNKSEVKPLGKIAALRIFSYSQRKGPPKGNYEKNQTKY
ncbi:MAG: hypothetical protein ABW092_18580, partial [Candidatus Thiodiazotropha sp.]